GTIRVIIAVNDSLLTGNQELLAGVSGRLGQNYPNPVMKSTIIPFTIIQPEHVTIDVFDVRGKRVMSLVDAFMQAGNHAITWDGVDQSGRKVPGGIYIYTMRTMNNVQSKRMVLIQ
ncbi:MAG: T9SS type A sorting domain-containing protein, partial [Bacteroidetes bacterium]|nr:T9SS type A sorting domain-containing protein [Bacteroidota bacterium]